MVHPGTFTLPVTDPVLIVALAMGIFLVAPLLAARLRMPTVVGVLLAGTLVGPHGLNVLSRDATVVLLGTVGLLYLMFLAGVEIDLHGFRRQRARSLLFGALTFVVPMSIGLPVGLALGYAFWPALLLASVFASHTLVAYPVVVRFGMVRNPAVVTAVGGTIVTDFAALLVLAVVAAAATGELGPAFALRLGGLLAGYAAFVTWALPRVGRWFFRRERQAGTAAFAFVLAALFATSYLAQVSGVEAIVGAFVAGLALNPLIPEHGPLANRLRFVGEAVFIPFFLLSVGMLVDVRVLASEPRAWVVMAAMTTTVMVAKASAAQLLRLFGAATRDEAWLIFGLSVPQAAATLAATLVGYRLGIFDDSVLNGAILMILVTCVVGPWVVEHFGRRVALSADAPSHGPDAPPRILVPLANPQTAEALMDLALALRETDAKEVVHPLMVVPPEGVGGGPTVHEAERMLAEAVAFGAAAQVPTVPLIRVDSDIAAGILRAAAESRATITIVGWDGTRPRRAGTHGRILDAILAEPRHTVFVVRSDVPLNTLADIRVILPAGADRLSGARATARGLKLLATRLGVPLSVSAVTPEAGAPGARALFAVGADAHVTLAPAADLTAAVTDTARGPRGRLVVVFLGRRGSLAWSPEADELPWTLAQAGARQTVLVYPAELPGTAVQGRLRRAIPRSLRGGRVTVAPSVDGLHAAARFLAAGLADAVGVGAGVPQDELIQRSVEQAVPLGESAWLLHAHVDGLERPVAQLALFPGGVPLGGDTPPARVVVLLLSPAGRPQEHLQALAELAAFAADPRRVAELAGDGSFS